MSRLSLRPGYSVSFRTTKDKPWMAATVQSVVGSTVWIRLNADIDGLISLNLDDPADLDCIGTPF
jgi:hypothetical protein